MRNIIPVCFLVIIFVCSGLLLSQTKSIDNIKILVTQIGKLPFKKEVPVKYVSREQMKSYLYSVFQKEYPQELSDKESLYLLLMGFLNKKTDIRKTRKKFIAGNIAGAYNEKTGELYTLNDLSGHQDISSLVLAHELRHSIQDQYFGLSRLLSEFSDYDDRRLAVLCALEGDATLLMAEFGQKFTTFPFDADLLTAHSGMDALTSFLPIGNDSLLYKYPEIIKSQLIQPYFQGLKFIHHIFKKKRKWKGVNKILSNPPVSTEQILHPEKYLKGESPVNVQIDYQPSGYKLYHTGVIGELYLNVILKSDIEIIDFAWGWGGDRFEIYINDKNYVLIWESVWDEEKFCSGFLHVFKGFVEKKYQVSFRKGSNQGLFFIAGKSRYGYFFIRKFNNKLFYVRSNDREQINQFINGGQYD